LTDPNTELLTLANSGGSCRKLFINLLRVIQRLVGFFRRGRCGG
jgi:hypothetical protein